MRSPTRAVVPGKFAPLHQGHLLVIDAARDSVRPRPGRGVRDAWLHAGGGGAGGLDPLRASRGRGARRRRSSARRRREERLQDVRRSSPSRILARSPMCSRARSTEIASRGTSEPCMSRSIPGEGACRCRARPSAPIHSRTASSSPRTPTERMSRRCAYGAPSPRGRQRWPRRSPSDSRRPGCRSTDASCSSRSRETSISRTSWRSPRSTSAARTTLPSGQPVLVLRYERNRNGVLVGVLLRPGRSEASRVRACRAGLVRLRPLHRRHSLGAGRLARDRWRAAVARAPGTDR